MTLDEKTCPYCGEPIKVAAIKCKWCREFLTDAPRPESPPTTYAPSGHHAPSHETPSQVSNAELEARRVRNSRLLVGGVVVALALGVAGVAVAINASSDSGTSDRTPVSEPVDAPSEPDVNNRPIIVEAPTVRTTVPIYCPPGLTPDPATGGCRLR